MNLIVIHVIDSLVLNQILLFESGIYDSLSLCLGLMSLSCLVVIAPNLVYYRILRLCRGLGSYYYRVSNHSTTTNDLGTHGT